MKVPVAGVVAGVDHDVRQVPHEARRRGRGHNLPPLQGFQVQPRSISKGHGGFRWEVVLASHLRLPNASGSGQKNCRRVVGAAQAVAEYPELLSTEYWVPGTLDWPGIPGPVLVF